MKTAAGSLTKGGGQPGGTVPTGETVSHSGGRRGVSIRGSVLADMLGLWYVGPGQTGEGDKAWTVEVDFGANYFILFYFFEKKQETGENVADFPVVVIACRKFKGVPALGSYDVPSVTDSQSKIK